MFSSNSCYWLMMYCTDVLFMFVNCVCDSSLYIWTPFVQKHFGVHFFLFLSCLPFFPLKRREVIMFYNTSFLNLKSQRNISESHERVIQGISENDVQSRLQSDGSSSRWPFQLYCLLCSIGNLIQHYIDTCHDTLNRCKESKK